MTTIIKENSKYRLVDVRGLHYQGSYQLQEKSEEFTSGWETCGVYTNKKNAIQTFKKLDNN